MTLCEVWVHGGGILRVVRGLLVSRGYSILGEVGLHEAGYVCGGGRFT